MKTQKFPKATPGSLLYKHMKVKTVELAVVDKTLGAARNGDLYRIEKGIATLLR